MSAPRNDGGPAFPHDEKHDNGEHYYSNLGMTLRDWFAGQALSALISRHRADIPWELVAPTAYRLADAMIAERSK